MFYNHVQWYDYCKRHRRKTKYLANWEDLARLADAHCNSQKASPNSTTQSSLRLPLVAAKGVAQEHLLQRRHITMEAADRPPQTPQEERDGLAMTAGSDTFASLGPSNSKEAPSVAASSSGAASLPELHMQRVSSNSAPATPSKDVCLNPKQAAVLRNRASQVVSHPLFEDEQPPGTAETGHSSHGGMSSATATPDAHQHRSLPRIGSALGMAVEVANKNLRRGSTTRATSKKIMDASTEIWTLAHEMNVPVEDMKQAADYFRAFVDASPGCQNVLEENLLTKAQFTGIACKMSGRSLDMLHTGLVDEAFARADRNGDGGLTFIEFAIWYSAHCFSEEFQLDAGEAHFREIVRRHKMPLLEVERCHRLFNKYDVDKSGQIDKEEFKQVIHECSHVPAALGLPETRVAELWKSADLDGSGEVDFEEFIVFYRKYFDMKEAAEGSTGFEDYYRGIRRVSVRCQ